MGAGLLLLSFVTLQQTDPGFRPEGVLTFSVSLPGARYPERADGADLVRRLADRLEALPGVAVAGAASHLPWSGWDENTGFEILNDPSVSEGSTTGGFGSATPHARFGAAATALVVGALATYLPDWQCGTCGHSWSEPTDPGGMEVDQNLE